MTTPQTWLWIHGWGMSPDAWGPFPSSFPGVRHRFIDFSACGTVIDFKRAVREAIVSGDGPDVVIAWSMGAMLALESLQELSVPEQNTRRLVVFGGTLKFVDRDRNVGCPPKVMEAMIRSLERHRAETLGNFKTAVFGTNGRMPAGAETTDFSPEGLASGLLYLRDTDLREKWLTWKQASAGRPEVLWIHGAGDPICPRGCVPEQAVIIPDAGHAPFADRPEQCLTLMETFIFHDDGDDDKDE